jgi:hypothetical protein
VCIAAPPSSCEAQTASASDATRYPM